MGAEENFVESDIPLSKWRAKRGIQKLRAMMEKSDGKDEREEMNESSDRKHTSEEKAKNICEELLAYVENHPRLLLNDLLALRKIREKAVLDGLQRNMKEQFSKQQSELSFSNNGAQQGSGSIERSTKVSNNYETVIVKSEPDEVPKATRDFENSTLTALRNRENAQSGIIKSELNIPWDSEEYDGNQWTLTNDSLEKEENAVRVNKGLVKSEINESSDTMHGVESHWTPMVESNCGMKMIKSKGVKITKVKRKRDAPLGMTQDVGDDWAAETTEGVKTVKVKTELALDTDEDLEYEPGTSANSTELSEYRTGKLRKLRKRSIPFVQLTSRCSAQNRTPECKSRFDDACKIEDFDKIERTEENWIIAMNYIAELRKKYKAMQQRRRRLEQRVHKLKNSVRRIQGSHPLPKVAAKLMESGPSGSEPDSCSDSDNCEVFGNYNASDELQDHGH